MSVTNRPIRILFVCHGNICRSPMAEFIFLDMVRRVGLADQFEIASAATSREEIWHGKGNPVYPPAKAELAVHGLSCDGKRARQLTVADYDYYDLLLAMDGNNVRNLHRMLGGYPQALTSSPILYKIMTDNSKIILTPSVHQVVFLFCLAKKTISIMRVVEIYKELFP